jgi:hypothetical protein
MKIAFWMWLALVVAGPVTVLAQGPGACAEDVQKFCKDVQRGQGRVRACLKQHENELSDACKRQISAARTRSGACAADIQKFCRDIEPGRGAIRACLSAHLEELTPECKAQVSRRGGARRRR